MCALPLLVSCGVTYKGDALEKALKDVLKKEYGISDVEVRTVGKTIGVYLPLEKLFSANLDAFSSESFDGNVGNLFEFNQEAMDKVQDVLFTTSRVVLSTDKAIDFYVLTAVETQSTGIEFVLTGNVMDMKQVRFWHIPLSEYRKRLLHDLSVNQTIVWKRTISDFFGAIGKVPTIDLFDAFFSQDITIKDISPFFFTQLSEAEEKKDLSYEMLAIRTKPINEREVLVYVKQKENFVVDASEPKDFVFKNGETYEYLIVLQAQKTAYKIKQVIPFYFIDKDNTVRAIDFPNELKIYDNIGSWSEEFELEEVFMGPFLARQISKRLQALVSQDPELSKTFVLRRIECVYHEDQSLGDTTAQPLPSSFSIEYDLGTQAFLSISLYPQKEQDEMTESIRYLLNVIISEFNDVVYGYKFPDFSYLELHDVRAGLNWVFSRHELELIKAKTLTLDRYLESANL